MTDPLEMSVAKVRTVKVGDRTLAQSAVPYMLDSPKSFPFTKEEISEIEFARLIMPRDVALQMVVMLIRAKGWLGGT